MDEIAAGIWRFCHRHPEWHPGAFGAEVASYAVRADSGRLLLVDPLVGDEGEHLGS